MTFTDYLQPISAEMESWIAGLTSQHLGRKVVLHTQTDFPDLQKIQVAIIGVPDNRGHNAADYNYSLDAFRKHLYQLFPGNWSVSIADMGDIRPGSALTDTYFVVKELASALIKDKIIPVIVGGSHDLTFPLYRAYDQLEQMVNVVAIDQRFDIGRAEQVEMPCYNFVSRMIIEDPNNLSNYANLGYQTYYNSQEEVDLIDKLFFDAYRIGQLGANITLAEPVLRDADLVSVDLSALSGAVRGHNQAFEPNGFTGREICALSRYAGISDKVSSFALLGVVQIEHDAPIMAQIIWYFLEGVAFRSNEFPFGSRENYIKYVVPIEGEENMVFYKSNVSDRWWIELTNFSDLHNNSVRNTLLPCSYEEYLAACDQEIPERWWRAQRRNWM